MTDPTTDTNADVSRSEHRVTDHYRRLLAANYTWMLGNDIERTAAGQKDVLAGLLPAPGDGHRGPAVDLGCGSGAQTLALADLGYARVLGVDTDPLLLAELRSHAHQRPTIDLLEADAATAAGDLEPGSVAVCVCMGDTLLHLPSAEVVTEMLTGIARALRPGGAVLLTYRDLTTDLHGTDRIIPVRSDDQRIMLCFLDFADADVVEVHDIIHSRTDQGWTMSVSSYPKLRLAPAWVHQQLTAIGLEVEHHGAGPTGMWHTLAHRPATAQS